MRQTSPSRTAGWSSTIKTLAGRLLPGAGTGKITRSALAFSRDQTGHERPSGFAGTHIQLTVNELGAIGHDAQAHAVGPYSASRHADAVITHLEFDCGFCASSAT